MVLEKTGVEVILTGEGIELLKQLKAAGKRWSIISVASGRAELRRLVRAS
jgi:hypothetical protein